MKVKWRLRAFSRGTGVPVLCAQSLQSQPTLWDPMDWSPPGSSVHGILQARILEWVATPSSRRSSRSMDWTHLSCVFCIAGGFFTAEPLGKPTVFLLLKHQASLVGTRAGDHSYTRSLKAFLGHDWNKLWCWRRKQFVLLLIFFRW